MNLRKRLRQDDGLTLVELMVSVAILTLVLGVLYSITLGMTQAATAEESKIIMRDESRAAMQKLVRELRMAVSSTIVTPGDGAEMVPLTPGNPVTSISFQYVADVAGVDASGIVLPPNGLGINQDKSLGLSPVKIYGLDVRDLNEDGRTVTQLVQFSPDGATIQKVLVNYISPVFQDPRDPNAFYNTPLGGFTIQDVGGGRLEIRMVMRRRARPGGPVAVSFLDQVVTPLN